MWRGGGGGRSSGGGGAGGPAGSRCKNTQLVTPHGTAEHPTGQVNPGVHSSDPAVLFLGFLASRLSTLLF